MHRSASRRIAASSRPAISVPFASIALPWLLALFASGSARAAAPYPPSLTEPAADGQEVSPADVHMETGPFSDPDPGDTHACTSWEIWSDTPAERIWNASCVPGLGRTHIHLGDGEFIGSYSFRSDLRPEEGYRLRVRHRDQGGQWSPWSQRLFETSGASEVSPLQVDDALASPAPHWTDRDGMQVEISPDGARLLADDGVSLALLSLTSGSPPEGEWNDAPPWPEHRAVRISLFAGDGGLALPATVLGFTDGSGLERDVHLPPLLLSPGGIDRFWISSNGSTFWASENQSTPDFSRLAEGAPVPWKVLQPGYRVEVFASGFQLPMGLAFVARQSHDRDEPFLYVAELYGAIRVVTRGGAVSTYADGLLDFNPTGDFPGSGEQGIGGICLDPASGDLFVSLLYDGAPDDEHFGRVVRLGSDDGGRTMSRMEVVLDLAGEPLGQSHFVSNLTFGPDRRLYLHVGDGFDPARALDLDSFRGKVLRFEADGSPVPDNPWYDAEDGISARDYVWAMGFRNPFGGDWRESDGAHYCVENGPERNDRLARIEAGRSYGWDGQAESMTTGALYNWDPTHAPVHVAFVQPDRFGGSKFPLEMQDRAFVSESGPTWASGPQPRGKRIVAFAFDASGSVDDDSVALQDPTPLVEYDGSGKATAAGLAAGPDGLYFTDLYRDLDYQSPIDGGANVLRIRWIGKADFTAGPTTGGAPLTVAFTDLSEVQSPVAWRWEFGDGEISLEQNPTHIYAEAGDYDVRLEVTNARGVVAVQRNAFVSVLLLSDLAGPTGAPPRRFELGRQPMSEPQEIVVRASRNGPASLDLIDVSGRSVARLFRGRLSAGGSLSLRLDPRAFSAGVHFLRLIEGATVSSARVLFVE